ncbi:hypothetical protein M885DRAFT_532205 [Pelagophyceae sp. CCMP2097]|nr:hypothetical protein M885DRAFT_532205 [Pelagophyceae sp. CCMP2097]|mmetsp:Transcript_5425/g.17157  ORF Transcript_5425/g.17157 Transcript_5425/m.17157 type:complete len:427 (-) Transcript_5425:46-1326(-)
MQRLWRIVAPTPLFRGPGRAKGGLVVHAFGGFNSLNDSARQGGDWDAALPQAAAGADVSALVLDCRSVDELRGLGEAFRLAKKHARSISKATGGRIVVLADSRPATPEAAAVAEGLEGFVRSVAKEIGSANGATATLLKTPRGPKAAARASATLRFLLSGRSAYVTGTSFSVDAGDSLDDSLDVAPPEDDASDYFGDDAHSGVRGLRCLVTGAAQGIGAAVAMRLEAAGATVVRADRLAGDGIDTVDVSSAADRSRFVRDLSERFESFETVVHCAGVLRDRTLAKMSDEDWDVSLAVNAIAPIELTHDLGPLLSKGASVVYLGSTSGVAGSYGQTNYATAKAALHGHAASLKTHYRVNVVSPGFIDTAMTQKLPLLHRVVGSRLNALGRPGTPDDVAGLVQHLVSPRSGGVRGQLVRCCGGFFPGR